MKIKIGPEKEVISRFERRSIVKHTTTGNIYYVLKVTPSEVFLVSLNDAYFCEEWKVEPSDCDSFIKFRGTITIEQ